MRNQPDKQDHIDEIVEVTQHLYDHVIPRFAKLLDGQEKHKNYSIILELHSNGINIRHLG